MKHGTNRGLAGCLMVILVYLFYLAMFLGFWALVIYLLVWFLRYLQVIN